MRILSIETSADETAVSLIAADGDFPKARYTVLGNALFSQVEMHEAYGGIYPTIAKREHAKTLPLMLTEALQAAGSLTPADNTLTELQTETITTLFQREPGLAETMVNFFSTHARPEIDLIGVTSGPGLEPTLWVGINFAKALALVWDIEVVPVNHMEGHLLVSTFDGEALPNMDFPALGLLISGGHTELDVMENWNTYECVGQTRDDAVGEAFDKVARMLELGYPGGPAIDKLAATATAEGYTDPEWSEFALPRPMLDSGDLDFSFSGIKTAVRYAVEGKTLTEIQKAIIAREFVNAVSAVLIKKSARAVEQYGAQSLIIGGGVSASRNITDAFRDYFAQEYPDLTLYIPERQLSTDNSIMIALAAHARSASKLSPQAALEDITADGNRALSEE